MAYIKDRKANIFNSAKVVLLGSYTYENSRLLLLSKSKAYPNGLANNRGQVGRHYFGHWGTGIGTMALFPFDINVWYGLASAQGTTIDEWADDHYDHSGLGFIGGTTLHARTELHPIDAASMPLFGRAPGWGPNWKRFVGQNAARFASAYMQTSTFPYETTFLDLDSNVRDPLGDPVCRITTSPKENETRSILSAQKKMEEWYRAAGAMEVFSPAPTAPGVSTHAFGGTRMGDNPETNVADRWGFAHEVPNLGILWAHLLMGTSGARNPTLTVQALAWRTAEYLAKELEVVWVATPYQRFGNSFRLSERVRAPHHLIRSDQRLFGFPEETGAESITGSPTAYCLTLSRSEPRGLKGLVVSTP